MPIEIRTKLRQPRRSAILRWRWRTYIRQIVEVADRRNPSRIRGQIPDPPAGDREGLREAGDGDRTFRQSGQGSRTYMLHAAKQEVLVDLICQQKEIVLERNLADGLDLRACKHLAAWVR